MPPLTRNRSDSVKKRFTQLTGDVFAEVLEVKGHITRVAAADLTRPNDTTPYFAKDVISDSTSSPTVLTFASAATDIGRGGYIVGARAMTDQKTCVARLRLHLFHTAPSAVADNVPYPLLWVNRANRIGRVDLDAFITEDSASSTAAYAQNFVDRLPFTVGAADVNIYGLVETLDGFTPAASQKFYFELLIDEA